MDLLIDNYLKIVNKKQTKNEWKSKHFGIEMIKKG